MKKLILLAALLPMSAMADAFDPDSMCTHDMVYTIYDEHGAPIDVTTFERNWELTCADSILLRYALLKDLIEGGGQARFDAIVGKKAVE